MASRGLNKVMLIGHVGRDPEVKYTPGGAALAKFSVATNEVYKDKEGNQQDRTEWHRILTWGRTAEVMGEYLKKGQLVYVEGRLQTSSWNDKDGNKRYITEIVASNVQFLGPKAGATPASAEPVPPPSDDVAPPPDDAGGENLPF